MFLHFQKETFFCVQTEKLLAKGVICFLKNPSKNLLQKQLESVSRVKTLVRANKMDVWHA